MPYAMANIFAKEILNVRFKTYKLFRLVRNAYTMDFFLFLSWAFYVRGPDALPWLPHSNLGSGFHYIRSPELHLVYFKCL